VTNGMSARESLEFLRFNHFKLSEQIDLEMMSEATLRRHINQGAKVRPFRIATWCAGQGFFISAWSLWEHAANQHCDGLSLKEKKQGNESAVGWIGRSLAANGRTFRDQTWFESANGLRNLIAHHGSRVVADRSESLFTRCQVAFPGIETWKDGYVNILHDHLSELTLKIEDFFEEQMIG
jgi:hypothetical protein